MSLIINFLGGYKMKEERFEDIFIKSKKGNYCYIQDHTVLASIFYKSGKWKWCCNSNYSTNAFATPLEAYKDMQDKNVLEQGENEPTEDVELSEWDLIEHKEAEAQKKQEIHNAKVLAHLNSLPEATLREMYKEL